MKLALSDYLKNKLLFVGTNLYDPKTQLEIEIFEDKSCVEKFMLGYIKREFRKFEEIYSDKLKRLIVEYYKQHGFKPLWNIWKPTGTGNWLERNLIFEKDRSPSFQVFIYTTGGILSKWAIEVKQVQ
ncbi:MAG: hypothetical protein NTZ97_01845 [Candidatus Moranbacteria bacterium]|nr:hypothetical protein [Candidatus Moranbacteria bacterium]